MMLPVACAVEGRRYIRHCAAMLHSLLVRHPGCEVHLFHGPEFSQADGRQLAAMVRSMGGEITFVAVPDEALSGLPTRDFTKKATWYRILMSELLPTVQRLLYLDADLVVTDDLSALADVAMDGAYVAAVTNAVQPQYRDRIAALGVDPGDYFNAGVMIMDLAALRADGCSERLLEYGVTNADLLEWRDQDAMNVVLGARRKSLHPRWNSMNSFSVFDFAADLFDPVEFADALARPAIRHFEGPTANKPWHFLCRHEQRELYLMHRRATPWPRLVPEGITPFNVLRRVKRGLRAATA